MFVTATSNLRFERIGPPGLHRLRYGGASHEVFTAFRDLTGVQKRSRWSNFNGPRRYVNASRIPQVLYSATPEACCCLAELVASYPPSRDRISPTYKFGWLPLLVLFWQRSLRPSVPVIIELTNFSENLREHEFGYWLHRQDVQLTTCSPCACGGPRLVSAVMLGLNVSGNLPNKACDVGHLSLADKRPWSITSDSRPRACVEQVTQVLNNSLLNNAAKGVDRYFCPA